jgi:hypothetical protein
LLPFEFPPTAGPPFPIVTAIVEPIGTEETSNHLSISCPAPPPPDPAWLHETPHPPEPPPPTRTTLITGPVFAGRVQVPDVYILVSRGINIELTPPAAIACAVIPVCSPSVTAALIVVVSPGK